jgi:hypothetical protein
VAGRVDRRLEDLVGEVGDVGDDTGVHARDGDEQCDAVHPADPPPVGRADRILAVLVERACERVVAAQLTEDECHEEHPGHDERHQP